MQKLLEDVMIETEKAWPAIDARETAKARSAAEGHGVEFYKLSPDVAEWYLDCAYESMWPELYKDYPADIVKRFEELYRK